MPKSYAERRRKKGKEFDVVAAYRAGGLSADGSYSGVVKSNVNDVPVQDADDL